MAKTVSKTWVLMILDESGSMGGLEKDVIGGSNRYVKELQKEDGSYILKFVKFDTTFGVHDLFDWTELKDVRALKGVDYKPSGGTPLYDAVGVSLSNVKLPKGDKGLCVVFTDGEENSSHEYTAEKVKTLIERLEDKGWAFAYLGAGLAGWTQDAVNMGFAGQSMATSAFSDAGSTSGSFMALRQVTSNYAAGTATADSLYSGISQDLIDGKSVPAMDVPVKAAPKKKRVVKVK